MTANQNLIPNEPELKDLMDLIRKDIFLSLNCHAIAKIQVFNPLNQTAIATVNYKKTFFEPDPITGVYAPVLKDYPFLVDCPVIVLGGGNGCVTFPILPGDDCLVLFNDRDIDNWNQGSTGSGVNTPRMHSFADAILLVGLRSLAASIPNYSSTDTELRTKDGLTKVSIKGDGTKVTIKVGPLMTFELSATGKITATNATFPLGDLITAIFNLFTQATVLGVPLVLPPTDLAVLTSFKP